MSPLNESPWLKTIFDPRLRFTRHVAASVNKGTANSVPRCRQRERKPKCISQGATKLHAREREKLLEAADALLFGEPENRRLLRSAEDLIESLEASERWSAESCDQLREHLYGCDAAAGIA